jgi:hypothetical protein
VGLLPMAEFLNGHLFFTRRLQEYSGIKPIAVHLTYQFGDTADYVYGNHRDTKAKTLKRKQRR